MTYYLNGPLPVSLFLPPIVSRDFLVGRLADGLGQQAGEDDAQEVYRGHPQDPDPEFGQMVDDEVDDQTIAALKKNQIVSDSDFRLFKMRSNFLTQI